MIGASQSWLPRGFEFLSGLPELARKRRYLMPVQLFTDDSGGKGHSELFVLAGLISHSDDWANFSDEWDALLKSPPRIDLFKMREAAGYSGQFLGFSKVDRDAKLRGLCQIINRHVSYSIHSVLDLDAY
jgi:hypothetical protein